MKVLVDTCVWSLSLRRKNMADLGVDDQNMLKSLIEAIEDHRATIIGPIRQEILSGIRDKMQFAKTEKLLEPFLDEEIIAADYIEAARAFNLCKDRGVQCGAVDILICAVAARNRWSVLTHDQGLKRCMEVLQRHAPATRMAPAQEP